MLEPASRKSLKCVRRDLVSVNPGRESFGDERRSWIMLSERHPTKERSRV